MTPIDVAVVIGSLRRDSLSRRAVRSMSGLAPRNLRLRVAEIGDLALYNEDLDGDAAPASWRAFRDEVGRAEAVLFVTPEYNRSVPGILKNAIDVGSRPYGQSVWDGKPAAIVSISPGSLGGFGANHHLRQSLVFLNMPVLQQPEAYIGHAAALFADDGSTAFDSVRGFLADFMLAFGHWIETVRPARSSTARRAQA